MLKKKIFRAAVLAVAGITAAGIISAVLESHKGYSGEQWYQKQEEYLTDMETFADTMDDAVSLYVIGSLPAEDLLEIDNTILRTELSAMRLEYEKDLEEHPIRTGTITDIQQAACDSVYSCYDVFEEILEMIDSEVSTYDSPKRLRYKYLAEHQKFADAAAGYVCAKLIEDPEGLDAAASE